MLKSSPTPILKRNSPPDDDEINHLNCQPKKETDQKTNRSQPETTISDRFDISPNSRQTVSNDHQPAKNSVALEFNPIHRRSTFNTENRLEKQENQGYLWVETNQHDVIFIPNHNAIEFHSPVNGINNATETEINHLDSSPATPILAPVDRTNTSQIESSGIEETRAAVQCASVRADASDDQLDTQSFIDSSSSTNSSNNDSSLTREACANLDDESYIKEQLMQLQRIRNFEVHLRSEYEQIESELAIEIHEEPNIDEKYKNALAANKALLSESKELIDARDRIDSGWTCESCTFKNEAYKVTGKDVCEMCEAPSPKKKHELLHR